MLPTRDEAIAGLPKCLPRTGWLPRMCWQNKQRIPFPLLSLRAPDSWLLHQNNHIVKYTVFQYTPSSYELFHPGSPRWPSDARALPLLSGLRYPAHSGPPSQPVVLILLKWLELPAPQVRQQRFQDTCQDLQVRGDSQGLTDTF